MNRNQIFIGVGVFAVVVLGIIGWFVLRGGRDFGGGEISATGEHTLGSPTAPIKMIEYAAPMCPICAAFNANEFPQLKSQYIDTGKVYYVFRVFPIGAADVAVEGIARCLPANQYFTFMDMMYRNQDKWDPDGHDIPDVRAALISMAGQAGLSAAEATRCMDDKKAREHTRKVALEGINQFGISGTPTFVIDGEPIYTGEYPWDLLKDQLDRRLAK